VLSLTSLGIGYIQFARVGLLPVKLYFLDNFSKHSLTDKWVHSRYRNILTIMCMSMLRYHEYTHLSVRDFWLARPIIILNIRCNLRVVPHENSVKTILDASALSFDSKFAQIFRFVNQNNLYRRKFLRKLHICPIFILKT
jgi:hypothetical protein